MDCKNLEEVRSNIDRIDNMLIKLIAERGLFVKQASKFKSNDHEVKAPQRVESIIKKVRTLAVQYGISPELVEKVYRTMITEFIDMEMNEYKIVVKMDKKDE